MPLLDKFYEKRVKEIWLNSHKPLFEINGQKYYKMPEGCFPPATRQVQIEHGIKTNKEKDQNNGNR